MLFGRSSSAASTAERRETPEKEHYRSRAFSSISASLASQNEKPLVLELGPARAANIEAYSSLGSMVFIQNIREHLLVEASRELSAEELDASARLAQPLADLPRDQRFDLVLCWDLLNYLTRRESASLFAALRPCLSVGTLLFILLADAQGSRDDAHAVTKGPLLFDIGDEHQLSFSHPPQPSPFLGQCRQADLLDLIPASTICSSVRLRNGLYELLFRCK